MNNNSRQQTIIRGHAQTETITIPAHNSLIYIFFVDDTASSHVQLDFVLDGKDAEVYVFGFDVKKKSTTHIVSSVHYNASETIGHVYVKSLLSGTAASHYQGMIDISRKGKLANASFTHHTLLLSDTSYGIAQPQLEIQAHDVKATHAATVSSLDDDILFYLLSRGIDKKEAQKLAVMGFASEYIKNIPVPETRQVCEIILHNRLKKIL